MFLRRAAGAVFGSIAKTSERQYASSALKSNPMKQEKPMIECCMSGCRNCPYNFVATEVFSSMKKGS